MHRSLIPASVLVFIAALTCAAQSSDPSAQSQSGADKPATQTPPPAPASSQATPPAPKTAPAKDQSTDKDQAKDKKKPKKVWGNEEVSSISGGVSVVGDSSSSNSSKQNSQTSWSSPSSSSSSVSYEVTSYRDRLAPLHSQIENINAQIRDYKTSKGYISENVQQIVPILEARRAKLQSQVDAIEEEARQHGISPGQLR